MIYLHCSKFQYTCISAFGRIIYVIPMCIVEKKEIERGKRPFSRTGEQAKKPNGALIYYVIMLLLSSFVDTILYYV